MKLAIILSHPTQYYSPWFRYLAAHFKHEIHVFYLWDFGVTNKMDPRFKQALCWDVDLLQGYQSEFLRNCSPNQGTESFFGLINPTILPKIIRLKPDAILLFGYKYLTHLALISWAGLSGIPLIFRGDSHLLGRENTLKGQRMLRWLLGRFKAVSYVGKANKDYFRRFGVAENRLFFAPHAVNHEHFQPSAPGLSNAARELRTQLGIQADSRVVLFAGKFHRDKNPGGLLAAFAALNLPRTNLVFVGDGEERDSLIAESKKQARRNIFFLPFANQSEMPVRYAMAQVFALPSTGLYETWGLAVNEAMHMGLPCLVSDQVGCQQDLVDDGLTGWVFKSSDQSMLKEKLHQALTCPLARFQEAAIRRVGTYTYKEATEGLEAAFAFATASK